MPNSMMEFLKDEYNGYVDDDGNYLSHYTLIPKWNLPKKSLKFYKIVCSSNN